MSIRTLILEWSILALCAKVAISDYMSASRGYLTRYSVTAPDREIGISWGAKILVRKILVGEVARSAHT